MARSRRRFGGYFSVPPISKGWGRGPDGRIQADAGTVLIVLLGIGLAVMLYVYYLLPVLDDLRCGPQYDEQLALWNDDGQQGPEPECESQLPAMLRNLHDFLPLLFLAPTIFLVFKQVAAPTITPVMMMVWIVAWLVPSPLVDVGVVLLGLIPCCVPHVVRGPIAALSHAVALVLWVPFSLFVVDVVASHTLPFGVDWAVNLAVFLVLPAVLISVPIIGRSQ
ncbi:MAG: hypothetical protein F4X27_08390 [Chloroflexi bacterium]|nr:hypothetical protein [Chloroflexota bacterium]